MHAHDDRDELAPPTPPARLRAIALAVLAHVLLIVALTWGVHWKTSTDQPAVQAELWAAVPQQAAPRADPPPEPTPPPPPVVAPPPPPPPPPVRQAEPDTREADLAIEREKKRLEKERKEREQLQERKAQEQKDKEKQREKERLDKERQEKDKRLAEEKKQKEAEAKRKQEAIEKANAQAAEERRRDTIRRMQGLAGATGGENATGTALRDAGPSGSYGGKVAAKVKPNIIYPDAITGNPRAEVEVRAAPDGTITSTRLVQSSGNKAWDDAVLRALQKTETLPRDVDGRVPSSLVIGFRPKD
ncbi:MAG: cell envelope integrity protein TolA [Giesbergeria sp.]|nr:cell envelope integrity protein TolA [Giesbergeria sp.]